MNSGTAGAVMDEVVQAADAADLLEAVYADQGTWDDGTNILMNMSAGSRTAVCAEIASPPVAACP